MGRQHEVRLLAGLKTVWLAVGAAALHMPLVLCDAARALVCMLKVFGFGSVFGTRRNVLILPAGWRAPGSGGG